jgi:nitric oxide dioxygenase
VHNTGEHGEEISTIFYKEMLAAYPHLNNYFNRVNQVNGRQPRAMIWKTEDRPIL